MFDIMFDIEFNRIKKRYGNIVSFNIGQTCGFSFMNSDFVKDKTVVAVFIRGDLEFAVEMKLIGNEYKCNFPDELCDSAETYKLTVIAFTNDAEAPTDFRSTTAYYGTIEDSGCDGTKFAPKHTESVFERLGEDFTAKLKTSLETATGESQDGKTWEELTDTVSTLPIITDEQTQALGEWDLIKEYFADYAYHYHQLFSTGPTGADGNERTYSLPYIYTPKLQWRNNNIISPFLVEYGADVSMATTLRGGIFRNKNCLQRLVLTGNANAKSLYEFVFEAYVLKYIKFETPSKDMLNEDPAYYKRAFLECYALETIDCELDFTGQTDTTHMFTSCNRLKNLRIKPFTLSTSLDLGTCRSLHHNALHDYDSLISILNGITYDKETAKNITITFSSEITDFTQEMVRFWNRYVYFCDDGIYYADPSEVPEGYAYLEMPLYDAFMSKGVTIAWKQ